MVLVAQVQELYVCLEALQIQSQQVVLPRVVEQRDVVRGKGRFTAELSGVDTGLGGLGAVFRRQSKQTMTILLPVLDLKASS